LERVQPRFERWWRSGPAKELETFTAASVALFRKEQLAVITDQAAVFYDAELPDRRVTLHPMARPYSDSYKTTNGTQVGRHAIFEVVAGEDPAARMPVVLHEVFHYFFASMRRPTLRALLQHFVDSDNAYATFAYELFNEAMATVLGNGCNAWHAKRRPSSTPRRAPTSRGCSCSWRRMARLPRPSSASSRS
jgi:hypothetical protein